MARRVVDFEDLGGALARWVEEHIAEDARILRTIVAEEVAQRTVAEVSQRAQDEIGDDGTGEYAAGFESLPIDDGYEVRNPVPYSGVVEMGRRPKRPGPPLEPILVWLARKHPELTEDELYAAASYVRDQIHIFGTRPKRFLGNTIDEHWEQWIADAVELHVEGRRR